MNESLKEQQWLAERFEEQRTRLRAVAYRMLGSLPEAEDAVQDAWIRTSRAGVAGVDNLEGWLTTVVVRVCLNMLESRAVRREESAGLHGAGPILAEDDAPGPEDEALLADSVGLALNVVLRALAPAERVAFVLHDLFGVAFDEIGPMVGRSPVAARQLASRARRRVQERATTPDVEVSAQREVVDAFFAAARRGQFAELMTLLDPDVVLYADPVAPGPGACVLVRGAHVVAKRALMFARPEARVLPVLLNGAAGVVIMVAGRPISVMGFTVVGGRIVEIDAIADPQRLARLSLPDPGSFGAQDEIV